VLLLNRTDAHAEITAEWKDLGLAQVQARVKDLWTGEELPSYGSYTVKVPAQSAILVRVQGAEAESAMYKPDRPGNHVLCKSCDVLFSHVAGHGPWARVQITYANPDRTPRYAQLRVNEQGPAAIAFQPTGVAAGSVSVEVKLDRADGANVLTFSPNGDVLPTLDHIIVQ
jgi:hypothetical protein